MYLLVWEMKLTMNIECFRVSSEVRVWSPLVLDVFLRSRSAQTSRLHVSDKLVQSSVEVVHSDRVFFNDVFVLFVGNCGSDKVVEDIHSTASRGATSCRAQIFLNHFWTTTSLSTQLASWNEIFWLNEFHRFSFDRFAVVYIRGLGVLEKRFQRISVSEIYNYVNVFFLTGNFYYRGCTEHISGEVG